MHTHQQSNEWEAPDLIAKQNPGTGRSLFAGKKDAIPYPYFALLDSDCTGGCILAEEDARTMRAFSSPIHVRVRFHF